MSTPLLIALGAGVAAWFLAVGIAGRGSSERARRQRLIARVRGEHEEAIIQDGDEQKERRGFRLRKRPRLVLRRPQRGLMARLTPRLSRAGLDMQPGEFLLFAFVVLLLLTTIGLVLRGTPGGIIGSVAGLVLPWFWLKRRANGRRKRINAQLNDLLQVVAGGLTAGQSFLQALSSATREVGDPLGAELSTLLNEVELGATIEAALNRLRERVGDEDLDLVIDAVLIQRRVGGNLSEVLSNISLTIRERIRMRGEVRALTGQARLSGLLLGGLPAVVGVGMYLINPEYMGPLITHPMGRVIIAVGLTSEAIGMMWMRKLGSVEV
jgi:tight adherence protein B